MKDRKGPMNTHGKTKKKQYNFNLLTIWKGEGVRKQQSILNGRVIKLQPVISANFGGSVQERRTSKRLRAAIAMITFACQH